MDNLNEFFSIVIFPALFTLVTAIMSYLGVKAKQRIDASEMEKTKKEVVEMCVKATEQLFKNATSTEKFDECAKAASEMLESKGITVTEFEIKYLIEAAIAEFNNAFENSGKSNKVESMTYSVVGGNNAPPNPVEVYEID